jgi:signal transduction histidine kinase
MSGQQRNINETLLRNTQSCKHAIQLVAYEIHDGFTQYATAALLHLEAFQKNVPNDAEGMWKDFHAAVKLLRLGIIESRRLINKLRHHLPEEFDLKTAIDSVIDEIHTGDDPEVKLCWQVHSEALPPRVAHAVFRIIQEGLTNAQKHSNSQKVQVRLTQKEDWLYLEVEDWGVGFVRKRIQRDCIGLEGIRLRAKLLGGCATIRSAPGRGTTISAKLPIVREIQ